MAIQQFQWSTVIPDPRDEEQLRRFRHAVGEHLDVVMSLIRLRDSAAYNEVRTALSTLAPLRVQAEPVIDGVSLMKVTGLDKGPAIGSLKRGLYRLQIERDVDDPDTLLSFLEEIVDQDFGGPVWP